MHCTSAVSSFIKCATKEGDQPSLSFVSGQRCWRFSGLKGRRQQASILMQRLFYPTETVLFNKITKKGIVLSFRDSPRKPLGRRPSDGRRLCEKGSLAVGGVGDRASTFAH